MKLGAVALDGTKVAADAALDLNRSHEAIEEEVQRMLREAKATDTEEDAQGQPGSPCATAGGRRGDRQEEAWEEAKGGRARP